MVAGVPLGAAGYAETMGGLYSGMSASVNTDGGQGTNTFANMDLGILTGVVGYLNSEENTSPISQSWATASSYPTKYFGAGGKSGMVQLYSELNLGGAPYGDLRGNINGGAGNNGLVVLKWYE